MEDMADVSGDFVKQLCVCLIQQLPVSDGVSPSPKGGGRCGVFAGNSV